MQAFKVCSLPLFLEEGGCTFLSKVRSCRRDLLTIFCQIDPWMGGSPVADSYIFLAFTMRRAVNPQSFSVVQSLAWNKFSKMVPFLYCVSQVCLQTGLNCLHFSEDHYKLHLWRKVNQTWLQENEQCLPLPEHCQSRNSCRLRSQGA